MNRRELFTAAQIGAAIGKTRFSVLRALDKVPPTGVRPDRQNAAAWSIDALPADIRAELRAVQQRRKYRTAADVLLNPPERWAPEIPLSDVHESELVSAQKLQRALTRGLALPADASDSDRARAAAEDYRGEFGHLVSERHLRNLIRRTLDRDREAGAFHRLELYLPESPRQRNDSPAAAPLPRFDFSHLEAAFAVCEDRANPTAADREHCWKAVVELWTNATAASDSPTSLRLALLAFLDRTLPRLAKSPGALERAFERRRKAYEKEGVEGLTDKRALNSGREGSLAARFPGEVDKLKKEVLIVHGDISQAFRNLMRGTARTGAQFGDAFRSVVAFDPRQRKSYVPNSLRSEMRRFWNAVKPYDKGPRAVQMAEPAMQLDWSNVRAGDSYSGDDFTFNHPFYTWDESGEFEAPDGRRFNWTRGQVLLFSDEKSRKILGYNAIPQRTYNSSHIHQGVAKLCLDARIGLPFKRFHFERSLWAAEPVKGMVSWTKMEGAFRAGEVELDLVHANTPRAKSIEAIGNRIQTIMEAAPFYVGRNERLDNYEREQAFIAKLKRFGQPIKEAVHPGDLMMSWDEFLFELDRCIEVYNNEPQGGKTMRGDTMQNRSPEEVWAQESGLKMHVVLPDSLSYLLATSFSDQTVQSRGVRAPRSEIWYSDSARLGELIGAKVRVRFNPSLPDIVFVCDLAKDPKERAPFAVGLGPIMPAIGATPEEFAAGKAIQKRLMSFGRAQFKAFAPKWNATIRREELGTADLRETGNRINKIEADHRALQASRGRQGAEILKLAERQNLSINPAKVRNPERVRGNLQRAEDLEEQLRRMEAAESGADDL